ncbi:MAG: hypothetical protein JWP63_1911, partial [Candidatus Solibacter sp.]|nr:hypothetical protein [Candidatus Solibacter sp.]
PHVLKAKDSLQGWNIEVQPPRLHVNEDAHALHPI